MRNLLVRTCLGVFALATAGGVAAFFFCCDAPQLSFNHFEIDALNPAQRAVADIDGDGFPDVFAAVDSESGRPVGLYWYEYPSWIRHTIAGGVNFRADDVACGDIDSDGDFDLVVTVDEDGKVFWYENPRPQDDPRNAGWKAHSVGISGDYVKDIEVADIDNDGQVEIITRTHELVSIFHRSELGRWAKEAVGVHPKEGMHMGDIDGDGDLDIVLNGFWIETPDHLKAGPWKEHVIDSKWYRQETGQWQDNCANVFAVDINQDGKMDVLISHSEKAGWPVSWYETLDPYAGPWIERVIASQFDYCETLSAADMDGDGHIDVIAGGMKKSFLSGDVTLFYNQGSAQRWQVETLARRMGIYNGLVVDIGGDGDYDLIGCRNYNTPPIEWWENTTNDTKGWRYHALDRDRPRRQFGKMGLVFSDLNHDGWQDVVAGSFVYLNPKGQLLEKWQRIELPDDVDIYFALDVDDDSFADLIGISANTLLWLEARDKEGSAWSRRVIGSVPSGRTQGYALAQIVPRGKDELVFTRGGNLFYLEIPAEHPERNTWRIVQVSADNEEEGVAAGDIDQDGDLDLAVVSSDGHQLLWLDNPGDGSGQWKRHIVGKSSERMDRIALVDIDQDGHLDIVATEETQNWHVNANVYWFQSPADPTTPLAWKRHQVATLRSVNSLDVADFNGDGMVDILVAEHTDQQSRKGAPDNLTIIYINQKKGERWIPFVVERGPHSSHLGARTCDLDNDGDLDVVSIGWEQYQDLHLWENVGGKVRMDAMLKASF